MNTLLGEARRDVPVVGKSNGVLWGSDLIVEMLRSLEIPFVILNPGSSFRGIHDSIVNHLGNHRPQILLVLHEEHAVAIAHGYTKVAEKPLAAFVHSNVGLMHASMAVFNAWADRVPVLVLGATGPVDAAKRRPWIDWLHTAQDQGALVRHFVKWDAQPASVDAAYEALLRAQQIAMTGPRGPVYVCFDSALQEQQVHGHVSSPEVARFKPPVAACADQASIDQAARWLSDAAHPVILMGRVSRSVLEWTQRIHLAERLNAQVLTDLKVGAAFPTSHPLHAASPGFFLSEEARAILRSADVVLSLDWLDLGGTLRQAWTDRAIGSRIVHVSVDHFSHNGWSQDHHSLAPIDLFLQSEPAAAVRMLSASVDSSSVARPVNIRAREYQLGDGLDIAAVAAALRRVATTKRPCLIRLPLGWTGDMWEFEHPLDYLGYDGGGGIGSGPGMSVGAALALKGTDRLPVAVLGDGDFLMGASAFWTAASAEIPLLVVVCNNRSFFNDELHQERVARERGRPVENRWIGQRITNPTPDLAAMARSLGLQGIGPVEQLGELGDALASAVALVESGKSVVVDVHVKAGYGVEMTNSIERTRDQ